LNWAKNPLLNNPSATAPCKDVFQAVCDELGAHYEQRGFKYSRSRPKIVYKDKEVKLEICFWSSHSNTPGQYVNLEILPNFYSLQLAKQSRIKGFLFGHTAIFNEKYTDDNRKIKEMQIFGDVLERTDADSYESVIRHNHNCNVFGLDHAKFNKIIEFIDSRILPWIDKIKTEKGTLELLENPTKARISSLSGKGTNSDFVEYVKTKFPEVDIVRLLGK